MLTGVFTAKQLPSSRTIKLLTSEFYFSLMDTLLHGPAGEQPTVKAISVTLKPGDVEKIVP